MLGLPGATLPFGSATAHAEIMELKHRDFKAR